MHFLDHVTGRTAHGINSHGGKQEGQHGPHKQAGHDAGVGNVDGVDASHAHVGGKQRQRGEGSRADGEALTDGGCGVANRVKTIGTFTNFLGQLAHFGYSAGVIGNGPVSVHS